MPSTFADGAPRLPSSPAGLPGRRLPAWGGPAFGPLTAVRLLIDISVLLDVALARPGAPASARLMALCGRQHEGWLAWHSVATLAYLIERQRSTLSSRDFIRSLLAWADVAKTGRPAALAALELPMHDFEDALQVAAAMACGAQFIITRNERDFKTAPVPALSPDAFLRKYPLTSPPAAS